MYIVSAKYYCWIYTCWVCGDGVDRERPYVPVSQVGVCPYVPLHHMTKAVTGVELIATQARVNRITRMLMTIECVHTQTLRKKIEL